VTLPPFSGRLRYNTLDQPLFLSQLSERLASSRYTKPTTPACLDNIASTLIDSLYNAYQGGARRTLNQQIGQPWWNEDCKLAYRLYRIEGYSKRNFRRTIRRAKLQFWKAKLDSAAAAKDVFNMCKWHKSAGSYRSPPLLDPL
jgi:hypothetical protein